MRKLLKYLGKSFLVVWLLFTSFYTYVFFRNTWIDFSVEEAKFLLPLFEGGPVQMENDELTFDEYYKKAPFEERIGILKNDYLGSILKHSSDQYDIEIPDKKHKDLIRKFKAIYKKWPNGLKKHAEENIFKVLIVKNLKSSGRIVSLNDDSGFIIFINENILSKSPNRWIADGERKNFKVDRNKGEFELIIETTNDPLLSLENVLIHEIGHAMGVVSQLTPGFKKISDSPGLFPFYERKTSLNGTYPFFKETYDHLAVVMGKFRDEEKLFDKLMYYDEDEPSIEFDEYVDLLKSLKKTSYPTMYSSRNSSELFAEMYYSYVHCVLQKKPYQYIVTYKNGKQLKVSNGITKQRCAYERAFIQKLFKE